MKLINSCLVCLFVLKGSSVENAGTVDKGMLSKAKPTAFNSACSVDCESESRGDREILLMSAIGCIIYLALLLLVFCFHDFKVALDSLNPARLVLIPAFVA